MLIGRVSCLVVVSFEEGLLDSISHVEPRIYTFTLPGTVANRLQEL